MFIDEAEIIIKAGKGGAGKVSFYNYPQKGPDGGNGGKGGDVYIKATPDLTALKQFTVKKTINGQNGEAGQSNRKFGKDGRDLEISIPEGCVLIDQNTQEEIELHRGDRLLIAKGGLGGRGNFEFKSSRNTTPEYAQPGLPGQEKHLKISLKLIADFGLIGLPNAGKSSLLNELTNANARVANYPFTTLEPNLGVLSNGKIIADVPGLIEGAHEGKGLGIKFLKHIEKVSTLLHCISSETENVTRDYKTVREELSSFNPSLLEKKEIILLTKSDLVDKIELLKKEKELKKLNKNIILVSIHDYDSIENLINSCSAL